MHKTSYKGFIMVARTTQAGDDRWTVDIDITRIGRRVWGDTRRLADSFASEREAVLAAMAEGHAWVDELAP